MTVTSTVAPPPFDRQLDGPLRRILTGLPSMTDEQIAVRREGSAAARMTDEQIRRGGAFDLTERTSHGEIAEIGWFALDALPEDTTRATRDRLAEIFGGAPADPNW